jgi:HAD superfamily hydrolase (TIGR01484 family)
MNNLSKKSLIVFDLDGTLAPSKSPLEPDMSRTLVELLKQKKVAVIGGGSYDQFKRQLLAPFKCPPELLKNFFIFPTTSMAFYRYNKGWKEVYRKILKESEKRKIRKAFEEVYKEVGYVQPKKIWGDVLEDRITQMSFSPLGQKVVDDLGKKGIVLKEKWREENDPLRLKMTRLLGKKLKDFEVRAGGITTIDVTRKGIDKGYGVRQIEKHLHVPIKDMVFIGDALFRGGNDAAAKKSGVQTVATSGPKETIAIIKKILNAGQKGGKWHCNIIGW